MAPAATPDISAMPDPASIGLAPAQPDISSMPAPESIGLKNPASFTGDETPEEEEIKAEAGSGEVAAALGTGLAASVPAWADYVARSAVHGVGALIGYSVAGGDPEKTKQITNWLNQKHQEDKDSYDQIQDFWSYHPRTEQAQAALALPGKAVHAALQATLPDNAAQTVEDVGGGLLRAVPPIPTRPSAIAGAVSDARTAAAAAREARAAEATKAAATPPEAAPVTADQLRAGPNPIPPPNNGTPPAPATAAVQKPRIAPRAGESAQEAATRQGITQEPQASTQPATAGQTEPARPAMAGPGAAQGGAARLFYPPQEDGPQFAPKAGDADQAARSKTLTDLNALGGGLMSHDRQGALSGDWHQTGVEHENAKIPDAPGQIMRDQIASEHQTLHNAADAQYDATGAQAGNNVDRDTLEAGSATVRGAIHAIEDHFTGAANGMYTTARAVLGDKAMPLPARVMSILGDSSRDVNPTSAALRQAAAAKIKQLWSVGDTRGDVRTAPGTVGASERFNQFLNEAHHNDSAPLIRELKNANDLDLAAAAGGNSMFETARSMIRHREQMLEPDGVNQLRRPRDRNRIDHEVPLDGVMDHVTNLDSEHFEHFMNVLRAGAHLSPEIAERSAAAIREIQGHMVASAHKAARGDGGAWNAKGFHGALNRFSTNMPSAFRDNPQLLSNLQTINRGGNILKMDKSYPGAVAQAARVGLIPSLAARGIKGAGTLATGGSLLHGNVLLAGAAHLGAKALEKGAEAVLQRSRAASVRESLVPRGQKGSAQIFNNASGESAASQEAINRGTRDIVRVDRDGNVAPVLRDVTQIDQHAGSGEVHVDRATGEITSRGSDLNAAQANGLRNRAVGLGNLKIGGSQRGSVRVVNGRPEYQANKDLEDFIRKTAPPHHVDQNGPTNFEELKAAKGQPSMPVNPQSAEGSIYSDVPTNIAFRAWHDKIHQDLDAGFDHDGELRVAQEHQRQAEAAGLSKESRRALWADTWETFKHHEQTGEFPSNPREFVAEQMKDRGVPALLNIGHHVDGEPKLNKGSVAAALARVGAKISAHDVVNPEGFEPTSVVGLKSPLTEKQGQALARSLGQKAIAQSTGPGKGSMFVQPQHVAEAKAQGWDSYNPDYFHHADGRTDSAHVTDFNPSELEIHPNSTVKNPQRSAYPGIYDDPKEIMSRVKTAPEDPIMKDLFGVTRKDLHNTALSRGDVAPKEIPGAKEGGKATGSKAAKSVMTDDNAARIRSVISAFKDHDLSAYHGMVGWYVMDALHGAVQKVLGKGKAADAAYSRLNTLMGMASPGSDVLTEINRGTAAHMMASQGKFEQFQRYGGNPGSAAAVKNAPELANVTGHPYHSTAQGLPMRRYLDTGVGAQAPKTSMYIAASEHPSSPGFQNKVLVGDSHFSRGVGLSDVRTNKDFSKSISGPEVADLHPWYHENVAKPLGLPSTSAQAVQWGALSHETGVDTAIGAPKLELFAQQVKVAADRAGVTPKVMLTRIIKGIAHAG